jgi:hypothetical protein
MTDRHIPGRDGNKQEFLETRDLEGRGKREPARGGQNINVDRLEWLLAHRRIDVAQHAAGRRLQRDCELAAIGLYAVPPDLLKMGGKRPSRGYLISDAKCDAIARVNAARARVGAPGFRILELVAIENLTLLDAARRMGELPDRLPLALCVALDALASFYRLA